MTLTLTTPATAPGLIVRGPFAYTSLGLVEVSGTPSFADWEAEVYHVDDARRAMKFWLGDLLNYGDGRYGALAEQVADARRFVYEDLDTLKWVCRHVPLSLRSENLSFSHHRAVAKLDEGDIDRLLRQAAERELSVHDLKVLADELRPPRQRSPRAAFQVATLPAPEPMCSGCGSPTVQLASGARGCLACEDVCPTCGELRYGPDAPHTCQPSGNWHSAPEAEDVLTAVFTTHGRAASNTELDTPPVPAAVGPRLLGEAVVESEYGRHIGLLFDAAPDLRDGQRVRVYVEVVK